MLADAVAAGGEPATWNKPAPRRRSSNERPFRLVDPFHVERDEHTHVKPIFINNAICTTKYTWINFLPICLFQEFRQSSNLYFLVIAILQSIKVISPITPITAITPLVFVVSVSLIREGMESFAKSVSDRLINEKAVNVIRNFEERCVMWASIEVGDILRIEEHDPFPADGILLCSSEQDGTCFVDTTNLDGEANLKTRGALRATTGLRFRPEDRDGIRYFVKCETPNQELYRFSGNLSMDSKVFSLSDKQFLLRGSTLVNTKWVYMLVVYTGHETKIMKNARDPHHKLSHVETLVSRIVIIVFGAQIALCLVAAVIHYMNYHINQGGFSYAEDTNDDFADSVILFLNYVVLMNTLIPISLFVTVEVVKSIHAKFITWDRRMYTDSGASAIANTSSLTDELGQVKYIFTDKTGTLTQNQMEFRKCSVDGIIYTDFERREFTGSSTNSLHSRGKRASVNTDGRKLSNPMVGEQKGVSCFRICLQNLDRVESRLALALALCHTVVCDVDTLTGELQYNSDSPDECALVRGAAAMGVTLLDRRGPKLALSITEETREESVTKTVTYTLAYEVLRVLHFTSDRKRMTIIIRDTERRVKLICKGADSVILDRCEKFLSPVQATMDHVTQFAGEGYRVLLFAERVLDDAYYEAWERRYRQAELDIFSKDARIEELSDEIERKLSLIGASAVEDKLQKDVPETISLFQKAGIKIWVLTGDKMETSLEMGKLCRVVTPDMKECILCGLSTKDEMATKLDVATVDPNDRQVLLIDGASLPFALMPTNRERFLRLALRCAAVIICRTSPLQKALVVELVKKGVTHVTLAVGDGANDVSMIRSAHVGVGVAGQEGMQAVRSSDYAVQQFSHLGRLLLHHGRLSYFRTAQCINYFLYKNIVFTLPQFIYGSYSAYSGQTFYCELYITGFNVVFTCLPVMIRAVMEAELPEQIVEAFPELYRAGASNEHFSYSTIARATLLATFQGIVVTLLPMQLFQGHAAVGSDGIGGDQWSGSVASFLYVVPLVHLQIFYETWNWTFAVSATYISSLVIFFVSVILNDGLAGDVQGALTTIMMKPLFWLGYLLCTVMSLLPWLAWSAYQENFVTTNPVHILRRMRFCNKVRDVSTVQPLSKDAVNKDAVSKE